MQKSRSFFLDYVGWVLLISVIPFFVYELTVIGWYWYEARDPKNKIEFYESFLPSSVVNGNNNEEKRSDEPSAFIRDYAQNDLNDLSKIYFLKNALTSSDLSDELKYLFHAYSVGELAILLNDKSEISGLIGIEKERINVIHGKISRQKTGFLRDFYFVFLFVTAVCLFAETRRWDMSLKFLPFEAWWFYLYLAVIFPAAVCTGILTAGIVGASSLWKKVFLNHKKGKDLAVSSRQSVMPYEEICQQMKQRCEKGISELIELFSHHQLSQKKQELEQKVSQLRSRLDRENQVIQELETEYFQTVHSRDFLSRFDEGIQEIVRGELERLFGNPLIKAVEVIGTGLHIYTDNLFMAGSIDSGAVGPFRIVFKFTDTECSLIGVFQAHLTTVRHPNGAGIGPYVTDDININTHCFGNVRGLIDCLSSEFKVNEATGIILSALQAT